MNYGESKTSEKLHGTEKCKYVGNRFLKFASQYFFFLVELLLNPWPVVVGIFNRTTFVSPDPQDQSVGPALLQYTLSSEKHSADDAELCYEFWTSRLTAPFKRPSSATELPPAACEHSCCGCSNGWIYGAVDVATATAPINTVKAWDF